MDLQLENKIVIVTGASKGIGLAITRTFVAEGATVVAASRTTTPDLADLGSAVHPVPVDLSDPTAPADLVATTVERFGRIDVLVNNAGGPPPGTSMPVFGFLDRTDDDWQNMIDFNLLSAVRSARAALPIMIADGGGSIINIGTTHAIVPSAVNVDYGAAKAALRNLTQALSEEFAPQGVRVNSVTPGPVRTPWWTDQGGAADILARQTGHDRDDVLTRLAPEMMALSTGRLAEPQEIADAVVLLGSPRSASTTGADIAVDAGLVKSV